MSSIDLVPPGYRRWLRVQAMLRRFGIVAAVMLGAMFAAGALASRAAGNAADRVSELQARFAISRQQQDQLAALAEQRAVYERQWSLLRGLRAGVSAQDVFTVVDRALPGQDLWFIDWQFRRAGVIVDSEPRGVNTGYFIVVPAGQAQPSPGAWQVETHMTVHGQAVDHQALSTFVRALFEQEQVRDVNVQRTAQVDYGAARVVDFNMTVILNSALGDG